MDSIKEEHSLPVKQENSLPVKPENSLPIKQENSLPAYPLKDQDEFLSYMMSSEYPVTHAATEPQNLLLNLSQDLQLTPLWGICFVLEAYNVL